MSGAFMDERGRGSRWLGALLMLAGAGMAAGGLQLAVVGGSLYYFCAGVATAVSGTLVFRHRRGGAGVYLLLILVTLAWAPSEVGFQIWQLIPRIDVVLGLGVLFLVPGVMRPARPLPAVSKAPTPPRHGSRARRRDESPHRPATIASGGAVVLIAALSPMEPHSTETAAADAGAAAMSTVAAAGADWTQYGGTLAGDRYSALDQLTPANVEQLQVAWIYHTGERRQPDDPPEYTFEVTPIKVRDSVYLCTPHDVIVALDAETGAERWRHDPHLASVKDYLHLTCRGVAYYEAPGAGPDAECPRRILEATADARLIAVNADTGKTCRSFGIQGTVDLKKNMGKVKPGYYYPSSAPLVVRDKVIVGGWVADNQSTDEPSGVVRAYDAYTGDLRWNFDAGNPAETEPLPEGKIYTRNSVNAWAPPSADESLGLIYLPMGNQTPDTWGGLRTPESERFSSGITAVDIETGEVRWVFQTVHHDLWDMDIGGQPSLFDMPTPQGRVPAVVAVTKRGDLFVLDRRNGRPLIPAPEKAVPQGAATGDHTSPTQPFSELSFMPARLTEADMWGVTPFDQMWCRIRFRKLRYEGIFTPPSTQGSLIYPGNYGVFDWGGIAVDPVRHRFFVTPAYVAFESRLVPHTRRTAAVSDTVRGGSQAVAGPTQAAPAANVAAAPGGHAGVNPQAGTPFAVELKPFLSPLNIPCQAPPWGYVAAVEPASRTVIWEHKNGTTRDNMPLHLPVSFPVGVPGLGGPLLTAGGLGFYSGTLDNYLRAYDMADGREIWRARLPAGGQATPMTYLSAKSGRQFIVLAAGGHSGLGTTDGDAVVAYARPLDAR
jgi:quinoprotein glucose dehydrogenase